MGRNATVPSAKTNVIEDLYGRAVASGDMVVTQEQVRLAILRANARQGRDVLSPRNVANFFKDLVRGERPERNWPPRLTAAQVDGRQLVGGGRSFEFVPFAPGQTLPLQSSIRPNLTLTPHVIESISLPLTSKVLGRVDETWLIQVAVNLRVIEAHFVTKSGLDVRELVHLQTGVKYGESEVDALFLATVAHGNGLQRILVTCEAKQEREQIVASQIVGQVTAAQRSIRPLGLGVALIVPIAIKAVAPRGRIYVAEFSAWTPQQAEAVPAARPPLVLASEGLYELRPPVPGVGYRTPRPPVVP
ncbi:hypothetical protein Mpop_1852 [Methylorubrum populi BJ001]|uniref:Uncharacterized protein n=1 Tax=Methylorubrum populi (strain ATCC BAA-705 / NCIMB 13946 / BJ001) TaxID=441620 RepID=B1ZJB0_METPB|nr:hypothetical protein Mpop_1852 [Methylorubrum populi BJ001]